MNGGILRSAMCLSEAPKYDKAKPSAARQGQVLIHSHSLCPIPYYFMYSYVQRARFVSTSARRESTT